MTSKPGEGKSDAPSPKHHGRLGRYVGWRYEYISPTKVFGVPLVRVAVGPSPETGRPSVAKGIIAVGDGAIGGLAIGGGAIGVVAIGGGAVGVFALGGGAIATMFALGGGAISTGVATGGGAIGLLAAAGGAAIGFIAMGGAAVGYYAYGGGAAGAHVWDATRRDFHAVEALQKFNFSIPLWLPLIPLVATLCLVMLIANSLRRAYAKQEDSEINDTWNPDRVFQKQRPSKPLMLALSLLILPLFISIIVGVYFTRMTQRASDRPVPHDATSHGVDHGHGPIEEEQAKYEKMPYWEWTADGPALTKKMSWQGMIDERQRLNANEAIKEIHQEYLRLEQANIQRSVNDEGRQVVTIKPFPREITQLEDRLWTALDNLMTVEQQHDARVYLDVIPPKQISGVLMPTSRIAGPAILGWGEYEPTIELWKVGTWFHWKVDVKGRGGRIVDSGPKLPAAFARFWTEQNIHPPH